MAVSIATLISSRIRYERIFIRASHVRKCGRLCSNEGQHSAYSEAVRLPQCADLEWCLDDALASVVHDVQIDNACDIHFSRVVGWRLLSVSAVFQSELDPLCRYSATQDEQRDKPGA